MTYNIPVVTIIRKTYTVDESSLSEAQTKALELAIAEHPGNDVFCGKHVDVTG